MFSETVIPAPPVHISCTSRHQDIPTITAINVAHLGWKSGKLKVHTFLQLFNMLSYDFLQYIFALMKCPNYELGPMQLTICPQISLTNFSNTRTNKCVCVFWWTMCFSGHSTHTHTYIAGIPFPPIYLITYFNIYPLSQSQIYWISNITLPGAMFWTISVNHHTKTHNTRYKKQSKEWRRLTPQLYLLVFKLLF